MNLRTYSVMISILECMLVAYLYNQENLPIQIAFGLIFIVVLIASVIMLIRSIRKRISFQQALEIFKSKSINVGSLIILGAIFLSPFVSEYREILSYFFSATAAIILTANVLEFAKSRLKLS